MKYYTYLIGWKVHNIWYYGARYGKKADPSQLWKTYFTSSKYVKAFRVLFGEPDVVEIRKTFDNPKEAKIWETKVLIRMGVVENSKWLNRTFSNGYPQSPLGISRRGVGWKQSEETKRKISIANSGRKCPCSESRKQKLKTHKGDMRYNYKKDVYCFTNGVESFCGTMLEFCEKYNLFKSNVCRLIQGTNKTVRGWWMQ